MSPAPLDFGTTRWRGVPVHAWLGVLVSLVLAGAASAHYMEVNGHWVTGMNNHVVWGLPHVFAVLLIVAASGAINVASMASAFGRDAYKPLGRLSTVLAVCLLAGGLSVLVLDLGRPERLVVAMTEYNFRSIFAWNIFLYTGFALLAGVYLWVNMERRLNGLTGVVGKLVLAWRFVLTTGTGCIFGFLVARESYDAAMFAPLFIVASLSLGTAVFLLTALVALPGSGRTTEPELMARLGRLMGLFALLSLWLTLVMHAANDYVAEHDAFARFVLRDGEGYTTLFWVGQVLFGTLVPALLLAGPFGRERGGLIACATLVLLGGFCQMFVIIIGGQAWPMDLLPGWTVVETTFMDGQVAPYSPSLPEWILGVGGVALAFLLFTLAARVLAVLPGRVGTPTR